MDALDVADEKLYSVEECNERIKHLKQAYEDAKVFGEVEAMETHRTAAKVWTARCAAATHAGRLVAPPKRLAPDVCDSDVSAAKCMKSDTAATTEAARAAVAAAAAGGAAVDGKHVASMIVPLVAHDLSTGGITGNNRRAALNAAVLKRVAAVVEDMGNMPGDGGAKLKVAFEAAAIAKEQVSKVMRPRGFLIRARGP